MYSGVRTDETAVKVTTTNDCSSPLGAGPQSCNAKLSGRPVAVRAAPAGTANPKRRLASMGARGLRAFNKKGNRAITGAIRCCVHSVRCLRDDRESTRATQVEAKLPSLSLDAHCWDPAVLHLAADRIHHTYGS
jgi:hypothetical protein